MALGFLVALIVSSYFVYVRGGEIVSTIAKLVFALIVYALLTMSSGFVAGLTIFVGAHSEPRGSILGTREIIIGGVFLVFYSVAAWLLCSFIVGHLIRPAKDS